MDSIKHRKANPFAALVLLSLLLIAIKMAFDVLRVPNFTGASVYVSSSPDGKFNALDIQIPGQHQQNLFTSIALAISGYNHRVLFAVSDASSGEILSFYHPPSFWVSNATGGSWECGKQNKGPCTRYFFPYYEDEVPLPPSWWKQVHAKLAVKIKGLENPGFKKVTVYE